MADVRLHRAQHARAGPVELGDLESLSQGFDFDRVAQRGTGAVRLDESDGRGVDIGDGVRLGDDLGLAGDGGCGVGHLHRAVVVDRRAADDGVDAVAVVERRLQRLEYHRRDPAAEDRAVGPDVERPAVARRRHHRPRLVGVADADAAPGSTTAPASAMSHSPDSRLWQARCTATSDDEQAVCTDRARPAQVQLVRHPRCQVVLVVEQDQVEHLDGDALADQRLGVAVRHQVVHQVAAGGAAGEDADRSVVGGGVVPGILEGVPGGLQEQPLLRVHHPGGVRGHPEVLRVELVDPVEHRPRAGRRRGRPASSALTPAAVSASSDRVAMDSSPRLRLSQNSVTESAPGNLPAIPMTAIALGGNSFDAACNRRQCSHHMSFPSVRRSSLAGLGALLSSGAEAGSSRRR